MEKIEQKMKNDFEDSEKRIKKLNSENVGLRDIIEHYTRHVLKYQEKLDELQEKEKISHEKLNLEIVRLRNIVNPEKILWPKCDVCGNEENSYPLHLLKAHEKIDVLQEKLKISQKKLENVSLYPIEPISNWTKAEFIHHIGKLNNQIKELKQLRSVNKSLKLNDKK